LERFRRRKRFVFVPGNFAVYRRPDNVYYFCDPDTLEGLSICLAELDLHHDISEGVVALLDIGKTKITELRALIAAKSDLELRRELNLLYKEARRGALRCQ